MTMQTIDWAWIGAGLLAGIALIFAACALAAKGAARGWIALCWTLGYSLAWIALALGAVALAGAIAGSNPTGFILCGVLTIGLGGWGTHWLIEACARIASRSPNGHRVAIDWLALRGPARVESRRKRPGG